MDETYDVLVAGGGAAGLSAALTLGRARRRVLVVDDGTPRNAPAGHVHNYLGREGTPPAELYAAGREEVALYGGEFADGTLERVSGDVASGFTVALAGGREVRARRLVVATGVSDELPDLPGVAERWGRDVLHCPYCHGWEVRDRPIGVLAAGPNAPLTLHTAQLFTQWSADVALFLHDWEPGADGRALLTARGVTLVEGKIEGLVVADDRLTGVRLASGEVVAREAVVVAPVATARVGAFADLGLTLEVNPMGTVVKVDEFGRTSVPGVWAAGNVSDLRAQVVVAAGQGVLVASVVNADLLGMM